MKSKKLSFEDGIQEMEKLVHLLESGQLPLDESFAAFEKAKALQKQLEAILDEGDSRIRVLTEDGYRELKEVPEQ